MTHVHQTGNGLILQGKLMVSPDAGEDALLLNNRSLAGSRWRPHRAGRHGLRRQQRAGTPPDPCAMPGIGRHE